MAAAHATPPAKLSLRPGNIRHATPIDPARGTGVHGHHGQVPCEEPALTLDAH
jgi:hypothetical protein